MQTVLTIAGFDPSSGAGITADLMVFAAQGLFGTSCITALTVQSTMGVAAMHPVAADLVRATLEHLQSDLPPAGIKIGMLATAEIVEMVADFLERVHGVPVVLDPVLRSSSGRELLSPEGIKLLCERLLPLVNCITPNLNELAVLTGQTVTTREEMIAAGHMLCDNNEQLTVLVTGGHLDPPDDLLITRNADDLWVRGENIATSSTHGTGCAFSSMLLSRIVLGDSLQEAALAAKQYVAEALRTAHVIGHGHGPINHLWPLHHFETLSQGL